ncbi:MAG: sporulation protein YunB [Firmicutes bacterium]|nr:sporulation protein YunB [Bacillota bacterium]
MAGYYKRRIAGLIHRARVVPKTRGSRLFRPGWTGKPRRQPKRESIAGWVFLSIILIISMFFIIDWRLKPTLHRFASAKARTLATEAVASAVALEIAGGIRWEDLYAFLPDKTGKIVLIQPNTGEIDRLISKVTLRVQEYLNEIGDTRVRIPLGQILGAHILANVGPRIGISITPVGTITTRVLSDFEQAGINQVRHKIYFEIIAHMQIIVPLMATTDNITTQVPITEVLIMGDVPGTYIQVDGKDIRNLFPED